ncbi:hypothetical protein F4225_03695 [Candidatus Poribacteria bacterium]|nr:hypothetical protein [Candidatus Poribacteria bacterium]
MGPSQDVFLDYDARWLDNHHFFNETHIKTDFPEAILDFPIEAIGGGAIRFKVAARSKSGLYHAQLCRKRGTYIDCDLLEEEEVHLNDYEDIHEDRDRIGHFITQVYHQKRPHSALGYLTPMEFEQKNLS